MATNEGGENLTSLEVNWSRGFRFKDSSVPDLCRKNVSLHDIISGTLNSHYETRERQLGSYSLPTYTVPSVFFYLHELRPLLVQNNEQGMFYHTKEHTQLTRHNFSGSLSKSRIILMTYLKSATATKTFKSVFGLDGNHPVRLNAMILRRSYATNVYRLWLGKKLWSNLSSDDLKLKLARQMNTSVSQLETTYISSELPEEDDFDDEYIAETEPKSACGSGEEDSTDEEESEAQESEASD